MKANELRVGNWVNDKFYGDFQIIGLVVFKDGNQSAYKSLDNYPQSQTIDLLNPIPLTEEWLIRFGFKTRTTVTHSIQYFIGENPVTKDWLFDILWLENDEYPFYKNGHFKLKYVHQLQNLYFALTGEELTITQ